jgi:hypothetical protein
MRAILLNFGVKFDEVPILCDNESMVKIATLKNKYIDIRHHFISNHINKGDIKIDDIGTNDPLADIYTKPLDEARFCKLRNELNAINYSNMS